MEGVKRGIIKLEIWNNNIDNFVIFIFEIIGIQNSTNRTIFNKIFEIFLIKIPSPNTFQIILNPTSKESTISSPSPFRKKIKKVLQFSSTNSPSYTLPIRFIPKLTTISIRGQWKGHESSLTMIRPDPFLFPSLLHPGEKMAIRRWRWWRRKGIRVDRICRSPLFVRSRGGEVIERGGSGDKRRAADSAASRNNEHDYEAWMKLGGGYEPEAEEIAPKPTTRFIHASLIEIDLFLFLPKFVEKSLFLLFPWNGRLKRDNSLSR